VSSQPRRSPPPTSSTPSGPPSDAQSSRRSDGQGPPPPPRHPVDGPPPPPARSGSEGESRATAAAWVAAVGAALLLAAAGTFLAVSWDALGLTARVAVVASATGAAILGGQRLRRVLPAVGAVVFHLGALLVPVDALGLAYQLEASVAARWAAVGLTASVVLPVLAVVGRSRILGVVGLAGLPVAATSAGLAGLVQPAFVLAALAVLAVAVEVAHVGFAGGGSGRADGSDRMGDADLRGRSASADSASGPFALDGPLGLAQRLAAPGLATLAVMVPLIFATLARLAGAGTVLNRAAEGWVASSWVVPAMVGVAAVGALAVTATLRRHAVIAGLALASAVVSVLLTVLPPATPRAVLLLAPAVIWLLAEFAALAGRGHRLWAAPTRIVANVLEVFALTGVLGSLGVLLVLVGWLGVATDPALGAQSLTLATAWTIAAGRRGLPGTPGRGGMPVVLGAIAIVSFAAGVLQLGGVVESAGMVLLIGVVASLGVLVTGDADRSGSTNLTGAGARAVAPFAALVLSGLAAVVLVDTVALGLLLVVLPLLLGTHLAAALRPGAHEVGALANVDLVVGGTLTLGVTMLGWVAVAVDDAGHWPSGVALLAAALGVLWLAIAVERCEPAADALRAIAMLVGLVVLVPAWQWGGPVSGGGRSGLFWAYGLQVIPAAFVPAAVVGGLLTLEAIRRRRATIAALAVPVVLRALAAGLLGFGVSIPTTGTVLLVVAIGAACAAALGPRALTAPMVTGSVSAGMVGWLFVGDTPTLRAALVVAAGLGVAAVGASRHRPVVGHLGGVVATVGIWQLLGIHQVTTLDAWLLPVAIQLAVAGELARRRGTSSWVAFVPPLLLVAVPAIAERIVGGGGWHAVLAGTVGVVAIVAGGARRLGGPLIVGTVVTIAVVLVETFAVVAAVPTWVWLAVGGLLLLLAAALIERVGGSPVKAVRRAVDVVGERFA
jgi:hypothetical protein